MLLAWTMPVVDTLRKSISSFRLACREFHEHLYAVASPQQFQQIGKIVGFRLVPARTKNHEPFFRYAIKIQHQLIPGAITVDYQIWHVVL